MKFPTLPQSDAESGERAARLRTARTKYLYEYSYLPPMAFAAGLPEGEDFSLTYKLRLLPLFEEVIRNHLEVTGRYFRTDYSHLDLRHVPRLLEHVHEQGFLVFAKEMMFDLLDEVVRPEDIEEYLRLFAVLKRPDILDVWREDWFFAYQRVGGFNPTLIARADALPEKLALSEETFQSVVRDGTTLDAALRSGRIYLCDFAVLDGAATGEHFGLPKYITAPIGVFYSDPSAGPRDQLRPVAIQLGQRPGKQSPLFTPRDGNRWALAKLFFQQASGVEHEGIAHLGACHLTIEPMIVATHRQLADDHPVFALLRPHFRFTLAINDEARRSLITPGGVVDTVLSPKIEATLETVKRGHAAWRFDEGSPDATFRARGVHDSELLADFPFRDDTLLVWRAIQRFVGTYLDVYYASDRDVAEDPELQAWYRELVAEDGARVRGMAPGANGGIDSKARLGEILSYVIYIAGPQHASVNFAQRRFMTYLPNVPGSIFGPPPNGREEGEVDEVLVRRLPPIDVALYQQEFAYFLGTYHYDKLGHYEKHDLPDPRLEVPKARFRRELAEAEEEIAQRNEKRAFPYEGQVPSLIPNSISI